MDDICEILRCQTLTNIDMQENLISDETVIDVF
jgi:hypothetical protein